MYVSFKFACRYAQEPIAQANHAPRLFRHLEPAQLGRLAEADDRRHVQRARAHAALVTAAVDLLDDAHARLAANVERAHALRPVNLVARQRRQVDLGLVDVERNLARALHGVDEKQHVLLVRLDRRADGADRMHRADLVVRQHQRDHDRVRLHRRHDLLRRNQPLFVDGQIGHFAALLLEPLAGIERRLVLGLPGDEVVALLGVELGRALERQVDRLGRARGPDDLFGRRADQRRHLLARQLDRLLRFPAKDVVARRRVAEVLAEIGQHGVEDARIDRRRRVVVHEDRYFYGHHHPLWMPATRIGCAPASCPL